MTSEPESPFDAMLREAAALPVPVADAARLPALGELLQQKYRIDAKLGAGGMGAVFRATNVENGKQVAIKWLLGGSSQACARFSREGRVAAQIDHPNVVNVFDLGTHRGGHFLVMELLRGESLGALLRARRLAAEELVAVMLPVLRGVRAAHAAGVIHRDLKPDNVFLCQSDDGTPRQPKVLDFGIAKLCARADPRAANFSSRADPRASTLRNEPVLSERLTGEGTGLGTLAYMSPEQLVDAPNVDERADIYAAGVMMYEGLTGRLPFQADNHNALVLAIAAQRPLAIALLVPGIDLALERIVMRAMAKDAAERHADVQALIDDLARWSRGAEQTDVRASAPPRAKAELVSAELPPRAPRARRRLLWGALLVIAVCAVFFASRSLPSARSAARAPAKAVHASSSVRSTAGVTPSLASERAQPALKDPREARGTLHEQEVELRGSLREQSKDVPLVPSAGGRSSARAESRAGALRLSDL